MKFTGNRQQLLEAFSMVGSVVPSRPVKPVLSNVRVVVGAEGGTLLATDLDVAIRYRIELESVEEGGDFLLPSAKVLGILRECTGESVAFSSEESSISLKCGSSKFKLLGQDPEEFPTVAPFKDEQAFTMDRNPFRTLIHKTAFATARERTRYAFNGVRFEIEGDEARMIATDGKRMAVKSVAISNPDKISAARTIPTRGLQTFDRVLMDEDKQVRISLDEKQAMIKTVRSEISSRLVEGNFPSYQKVIPAELPNSATFRRTDIVSALRQAAILTNDESRSVRLSFEEKRVIMTSRAVDMGESRIEVEAQYDGQPISMAFNPDYLLEGIKVMDAESIVLRLSEASTPACLEGEENFIYVVMPITLRAG